jgi:hypothetical protein
MPYVPQNTARQRPARARFAETIPVVLRFSDGGRVSGRLQVVSVTGGLLCLPRPQNQGAIGKLMFLTQAGSVLAVAEMLCPLCWELQPFRFVSLFGDDQSRLQKAIGIRLEQVRREHEQLSRDRDELEKFRAW